MLLLRMHTLQTHCLSNYWSWKSRSGTSWWKSITSPLPRCCLQLCINRNATVWGTEWLKCNCGRKERGWNNTKKKKKIEFIKTKKGGMCWEESLVVTEQKPGLTALPCQCLADVTSRLWTSVYQFVKQLVWTQWGSCKFLDFLKLWMEEGQLGKGSGVESWRIFTYVRNARNLQGCSCVVSR